MSSHKMGNLLGALVFLVIAVVALYRLMVGFPIEIGGVAIGQTSTFFAFVCSAALCLILFRGTRREG